MCACACTHSFINKLCEKLPVQFIEKSRLVFFLNVYLMGGGRCVYSRLFHSTEPSLWLLGSTSISAAATGERCRRQSHAGSVAPAWSPATWLPWRLWRKGDGKTHLERKWDKRERPKHLSVSFREDGRFTAWQQPCLDCAGEEQCIVSWEGYPPVPLLNGWAQWVIDRAKR